MIDVNFEYPWALTLITVVIACVFFCKEKKSAIYFPQNALLQNLIKSRNIGLNLLKFSILSLAIIALASPIKTEDIALDNSKGYEISLILDASGSMSRLNKFAIVKDIVADFIDKRKQDKLALSIFADFAYVVVPLTYDKKSVKKLLNNIEVGIAGQQKTALYEALFLSSKLYENSQSKEKIAILLTDGIDNAENVPLEVAIESAKKYGIKVYTIGVGSDRDFNPSILKQIAEQTGGEYFSANSADAIKDIYKQINTLEKSDLDTNQISKITYYFEYPLWLACLLLMIYFWQRNTWKK